MDCDLTIPLSLANLQDQIDCPLCYIVLAVGRLDGAKLGMGLKLSDIMYKVRDYY
jgi:hypothetical protein